jgi:transcriptional regulator with PAS, ATPase and Fis domain
LLNSRSHSVSIEISTMDETQYSIVGRLLTLMDMAVFELDQNRKLHVLGEPPAWILGSLPKRTSPKNHSFKADELSDFLPTFLDDAEKFWKKGRDGYFVSAPWTETDPNGKSFSALAMALSMGRKRFLVLEFRNGFLENTHKLLQLGREGKLANERLHAIQKQLKDNQEKLKAVVESLEESRVNQATLLNLLSEGSLLVDADGAVQFINASGERLLGLNGRKWKGWNWVKMFQGASGIETVSSSFVKPLGSACRLSLELDTVEAKRFLEAEVHPHPELEGGRIILLYDVSQVHDLREALTGPSEFMGFIGRSGTMQAVYRKIREVASVDWTVLIQGETGSGKELAARAIHQSGPRKHEPFLAVNCAGLSDSLLGAELFGYKRGAFTGAVEDHKGLFEAAEAGTLFLDEIGDISPGFQRSLLRVLEERMITRVGETKPRGIKARIIVATHRDLEKDVTDGSFRADLLYRIRVARIKLPRLGERSEDIPLLVENFLKLARASTGKSVFTFSALAMAKLLEYPWPGNVRELKSTVEYSVLHCQGGSVLPSDLPPELGPNPASSAGGSASETLRKQILLALKKAGGKRTDAAKIAGMSRATFYRRLADLGL